MTLGSLQDPVLVLPCMSKRRSGAGIGLYREIQNQYNNVSICIMHVGEQLKQIIYLCYTCINRKLNLNGWNWELDYGSIHLLAFN